MMLKVHSNQNLTTLKLNNETIDTMHLENHTPRPRKLWHRKKNKTEMSERVVRSQKQAMSGSHLRGLRIQATGKRK